MKNLEQYYNPLSIAKVIMTIGIVYVHIIPPSILISINQAHPSFNIIYAFITETLVRGCVPFYFVVSGFMFFKGKIEGTDYKNKIFSRVRRLLIPLLIWNTLFILLFCREECHSIKDVLWLYIRPANFPLWFLRDLFFLSLITPLLGILISKGKQLFLLVLLIVYLIISPDKETSFISSLTFFSLGACLGTDQNLIDSIIRKKHIIFTLFFIVWGLDIFLYIVSVDRSITHATFKILFICSVICLLKYLSKDNRINKFLLSQGNTAFFLYCTHIFYIAVLHLYYPEYYKYTNIVPVVFVYIFTPWMICICSYVIYNLMMKVCPSVLNFTLGVKKHNI